MLDYLGRAAPSFEEFDRWIVAIAGGVDVPQIAHIIAEVSGRPNPPKIARRLAAVERSAPVRSTDDLAHWREHRYVVPHDTLPTDTCEGFAQAL